MREKNQAVQVVSEFWRLMATNNFDSVGNVLADDYILDWPQSGERIRGRGRFAAVIATHPAHGAWDFEIHRIIGMDGEAVSEVTLTDGQVGAKTISFFTVVNRKITHQTEYWLGPFPPSENRKHLVEMI